MVNNTKNEINNLNLLLQNDTYDRSIDDAQSSLKFLSQIELPKPHELIIPPNLIQSHIEPFTRQAESILNMLRPSNTLNRTYQALESYKTISNNLLETKNATLITEQLLEQSIDNADILQIVMGKRQLMANEIDKKVSAVQNLNESLHATGLELNQVEADLKSLESTVSGTLKYTENVNDKGRFIKIFK